MTSPMSTSNPPTPPDSPYHSPRRLNTEGPTAPPNFLPSHSCVCTGPCRARHRCCNAAAKSCTADCTCKGLCDNPWNAARKEKLFGKSDDGEEAKEVFPNECFWNWYKKCRTKANVDLQYLFRKVLPPPRDHYGVEALLAWEREYKDVWGRSGDDARRLQLQSRLVRFALTDDRDLMRDGESEGVSSWYSSCWGRWVDHQVWHCWECGTCKTMDDWHCSRCNTCPLGGVEFPCDGCGGVSTVYEGMQKMSRRMGRGSVGPDSDGES